MTSMHPSFDDDMPAEIDFSGGKRGQFYRPDAALAIPIYLEAPLQDRLIAHANLQGIGLSELVNRLLKKGIELIGSAK
jgi:hypothetical protein